MEKAMIFYAAIGYFAKELTDKYTKRATKATLTPIWKYVDTLLPAKADFEDQITKACENLNKKADAILQDTSFILIKEARDAVKNNRLYLKKELLRFLCIEAAKESCSQGDFQKYCDEVERRRIKLGENLNNGVALLDERLRQSTTSCDFPTRILFETIINLAVLELVFFSWEYFLSQSLNKKPGTLCSIQNKYCLAKAESIYTITKYADRLCSERLKKCTFTATIERIHSLSPCPPHNGLPRSVKYEYKDTFSSAHPDDPFRGDTICIHDEVVNNSIIDQIAGKEALQHLIPKLKPVLTAYEEFRATSKMHREHRYRIELLNDDFLRAPAIQVVSEIKNLPYFLSLEQPQIEVQEGRLPEGWEEYPQLTKSPPYNQDLFHPYLDTHYFQEQHSKHKPGKGYRLYAKSIAAADLDVDSLTHTSETGALCLPTTADMTHELNANEYLESLNKKYRLTRLKDGELELVCMKNNQLLWRSKSFYSNLDSLFSRKKSAYMELQNDGNIVLYNSKGTPTWSSGTDAQTPNMLRHLNGEERYEQTLRKGEFLISDNGDYKLELKRNGHLVLINTKNSKEIWSPDTQKESASELRMQADGNLVLYRKINEDPIWATNTNGNRKGISAVVEDWGDLCLYDNNGNIIWSIEDSGSHGSWHRAEVKLTNEKYNH